MGKSKQRAADSGNSKKVAPAVSETALDAAVELLDLSLVIQNSVHTTSLLPPTWPQAAMRLTECFRGHTDRVNAFAGTLKRAIEWFELGDARARTAHRVVAIFADEVAKRLYTALLMGVGSQETVVMPKNASGDEIFPDDGRAMMDHLRSFGESAFSSIHDGSVKSWVGLLVPATPSQICRVREQLSHEAATIKGARSKAGTPKRRGRKSEETRNKVWRDEYKYYDGNQAGFAELKGVSPSTMSKILKPK